MNKKILVVLIFLFMHAGCLKVEVLDGTLMADVQAFGDKVKVHGVIACAANHMIDSTRTEVYFFPPDGVGNSRVYFSGTIEDQEWNYNNYQELVLPEDGLFNGYLRKYLLAEGTEEKWCIVTFEQNDSMFLSDPIRLRHISQATEINPALITVIENSVNPGFSWQDGQYNTNDIFFQVISDTAMNFISGTYTRDRNFTFYDLSNVVLDVNQGNMPQLETGNDYDFTLMAVDDDNWVNLVGTKRFSTD